MSDTFGRPVLCEAFVALPRRPEIYFYTSNVDKFLQARMVLAGFGLTLRFYRGRSEPYAEDYAGGKERLLTKAVSEVARSVGESTLFFVEDTSLRIEALSGPEDFPGLRVKEWFERVQFGELDEELFARSNNRIATVKSDIALRVPGLARPVFFHGETIGRVADTAPEFVGNAQCPWLTPDSFNGWFIPDGAVKRLGEMSFEEAWNFDFRVRSLVALVRRVEEYAAVLNLPLRSYSRTDRRPATPSPQPPIPGLRSTGPKLIVIGRTCVGKTTFGNFATREYAYQVIEASSALRAIGTDLGFQESGLELAERVFTSKGPDAVARWIIQRFAGNLEHGFIITGFRTIEEVELFKAIVPDVRVILLEADERTRFQRYLQRGRPGGVTTVSEFRKLDGEQALLGLLRVAADFADVVITNEGTIDEFESKASMVISGSDASSIPGMTTVGGPRIAPERSQLYRSLLALDAAVRPLNCAEIEEFVERHSKAMGRYNSNKVLKAAPELARRLEFEGSKIRYEITNAGRAYVRLMQRFVESARPTAECELSEFESGEPPSDALVQD